MQPTARVALVTGGARRVGRAIVQRLATEGFDVAFTYRKSRQDADELAQSLLASGRRTAAIEADLTQPGQATEEIFSAVDRLFGRLDVLVHNASLYQPSSLAAFTTAQSRAMWAIHVEAPMLLCRRFERYLRTARGHVINMVDLLAERPWPEYLVYCASKAGLLNLTLGLARELAPDVTVNGISPGVVAWPNDYSEQERQRYLHRVPLGREGTPEDVANAVAFLISGGSYITGQILRLDGGRSIT